MTKGGLKLWAALGAVVVLIGVGLGLVLVHDPRPDRAPAARDAFPQVDQAALNPAALRVIDVLRTQYDTQPPGEHFAEGADEPWCADFVSWVLNEAGQPLANPNSGHWRIPGVYTLQEYFQAAGRFADPDGYRPQAGDVALYAEGSPLGLHTNFVVTVADDEITTVGGNEDGGIRVRTYTPGPAAGLLGYGRLS